MPQTRHTLQPINPASVALEDLPQPVVGYARDLAASDRLPFHHHRRNQLVYASHGVMSVTTREASFVVPPQRAVWMPGGVEHQIDARGAVAMRTLYIEPALCERLPHEVCVLQVSPLLRELILHAIDAGPHYAADSPQARVVTVILDQIGAQPLASLALPMPSDPRLLRITRALIEQPADRRNLNDWAQEVGASQRTLVRLFMAQTGMSFRQWRQQRRLLRALELLAVGDSVTNIALELGYENTSAFIAMFRRCLGETPSRYLRIAENQSTSDSSYR